MRFSQTTRQRPLRVRSLHPPPPVLSELCTAECLSGLESWRDNLRDACTDEDTTATAMKQWEGSERGQSLLGSFLNENMYMVEYIYYAGCLKDLSVLPPFPLSI